MSFITSKSPIPQNINCIGEEVAELVNGEGYHTLNFDAANLTSVIYFFRIVAGNFVHTNKMLLIK